MSLSEEEADKLWLEMYEKDKIKKGILFATELHQPVNIRKRLDDAKAEMEKIQNSQYSELTDVKGYSWEARIDKEHAKREWFKKWFGEA